MLRYFPDDKTSNFLTKLPRTLHLDGEWEVGLTEIDYPHTWHKVREGKNSVEISVPDKWLQYSAWILRESTGCDRRIAQSWTS